MRAGRKQTVWPLRKRCLPIRVKTMLASPVVPDPLNEPAEVAATSGAGGQTDWRRPIKETITQFSLRDLFFGTTLFACFLTLAVFFPTVAITTLVAATLIFLSAVLAFISDRVPAL